MATTSIDLPITLGAIEIGIILNTFFYGLMLMQTVYYFHSRFKDPWQIRTLVWWTVIIDTAHVMIACELLWKMTVVHFGDFSTIGESHWEYTSSPLFIAANAVPIQLYLSLRIKKLAGEWGKYVFGFLALLSATQGALAVYLSIRLLIGVTSTAGYNSYIQVASGWTGIGLTCDLSITLLLIVILVNRRTGFKQTDMLIIRIITAMVEAAVPVSIFAIGHLISIKRGPQTGLHELFAFPLGRLYTNTLLGTLNSRTSADVSKQGSSSHMLNEMPVQRMPTSVRVEVDQIRVNDLEEGLNYNNKKPEWS